MYIGILKIMLEIHGLVIASFAATVSSASKLLSARLSFDWFLS